MSDARVPSTSHDELEVLRRIALWESNRDFYLQLLRENPELTRFQDARTLENFGIVRTSRSG